MDEGTGYSSAAAERYELVRRLLLGAIPPPAAVVELGAAPGEQSIGLARLGYAVTAVDIGEESDAWEGSEEGTMVRRFQEEGVDLVTWNLEEVPYPLPDAGFDAVVMTEVLEHLRDYPARSLREVRRILRPDGRLYLTTPNAAYVRNRVKLLLGRNVVTPLEDWIGGVPFARHAREYTFGEVSELLDHVGFRVELQMGRHLHTRSGRTSGIAATGKRAIDRLAQIRPTLGPSIVVVARPT